MHICSGVGTLAIYKNEFTEAFACCQQFSFIRRWREEGAEER